MHGIGTAWADEFDRKVPYGQSDAFAPNVGITHGTRRTMQFVLGAALPCLACRRLSAVQAALHPGCAIRFSALWRPSRARFSFPCLTTAAVLRHVRQQKLERWAELCQVCFASPPKQGLTSSGRDFYIWYPSSMSWCCRAK